MKDETTIVTVGCHMVCAALLIMVCIAGCSATSDGSIQQPTQVDLTSGESVDVQWKGRRAASVRTASGETVQFVDGEAKVDDQLIIQSADGQIDVFRKPNAVVTEINQLPHLYLKEGSLEELITDGFQGAPYIGPDRALYWTARTCTNPKCKSQSMGSGERPYLFIHRLPAETAIDAGTLADAPKVPDMLTLQPCPICRRKRHIVQYELPTTVSRKQKLAEELARVRAARDASSRAQ